jgi:hypothetical protein
MNDFAGPLVPGRLTYIAAFPGNGKTSFAAHLLQHFLRVQDKKVTYLPLEADPGETFTRLACLDCGISADDALSKRLKDRAEMGDPVAKAQHDELSVAYRLMREDRSLLESLRIEPIDALTPSTFERALKVAHLQESDVVIVDHMDHAENDVGESGPEIALSNQMQSTALRAAKRVGTRWRTIGARWWTGCTTRERKSRWPPTSSGYPACWIRAPTRNPWLKCAPAAVTWPRSCCPM